MLTPTPMTRYIRGLEYRDMPTLLKDFRSTLEREAGVSLATLEINAGLLITDLLTFLGASENDAKKVLGRDNYQAIRDMIGARVKAK